MRSTVTALAVAALTTFALVTPAHAAPGPVALWELNETTGRVMLDSGPNRISGTIGTHVITNGSTYTFTGSTAPDDQRLALAPDDNRLDPGTESYTVAVRFITTVGSPNIVQKGQAGVAGGFWKVVLNSGYPRCEFKDGTGRALTADLVGTSAANRADDGQWHVVHCYLASTGARVVLDPGTTGEATRFVAGTHSRIDNTRQLSIGGKVDCNGTSVGCDYFTGSIDYVRINRLAPALAAVTRLSDFNRDGLTDLIARDATGWLWLYPGNGAGEFKPRRQIGHGWNGMSLIVTPGDVTGDGNADVLGRDTAGRLWLYPGNGAAGFLSKRQIGHGWNTMTAVTNAANLNGTGRPDVLARDIAGDLWLYPLVGNATFGPRSKVGNGWNGYTILGPGDLSGDARADILARDSTGSVWLYPGTGTGLVGRRTLVSAGWAEMTALITPGNWDLAAGNDLLARDAAGALWFYPGNNAGGLGSPRQIGHGWQGMTYIG